jgi:glycogen synthase
LQDVYQPKGQYKNAKVAYCIHNIAFQGRFWPESFKDMQLPQSTMSKLGFIDGYSKVSGSAGCSVVQQQGRSKKQGVGMLVLVQQQLGV